MTQDTFDKLIEDAFELHCFGDMSEIGDFLNELSCKYKLVFNNDSFRKSQRFEDYKQN